MAEAVKIVLENYVNNACYAGQTLTGRVDCFFKKKKKVRGIRLKFNGKAHTGFSLGSGKSATRYDANEVYFDQQYDLVSGGDDFYLEAGRHSYPFSYILPQPLPSSFGIKGVEATIEYSIKVTVDRPWKFDYEDKLVLNVVEPFDLNLLPALKKPHCASVDGEVGLFGKDPVNLRVTLPHTGFVEGETMTVTVSVINMSSVTAQLVKFKMIEDVIVRGFAYANRAGFQEVVAVIAEWQCDGVVGEAHTEKSINSILIIPRTPLPASLKPCTVIDVAYRLETKLVMPFPYSDIVANIPITMGTIPLSETDGSQLQATSYPPNYNQTLTTPLSGRSSPYGSMGKIDHSASAPPAIGFNVGLLPQSETKPTK